MTSTELNRIIIRYQQNLSFEDWISRQTRRPTCIYVCEFGTIWKFTSKEWWQEVIRIVQNDGEHEFTLFKALHRRPKSIREREDGSFDSINSNVRCINPKDWTLDEWKHELIDR